jgi:hypothetical protein
MRRTRIGGISIKSVIAVLGSGHAPEPRRRTGGDRCIELWYARMAQFFEAIGPVLPAKDTSVIFGESTIR